MAHYIPENYKPHLNLKETELAIKKVKDFFERDLAIELNLTRVSAPLFVDSDSGMNDNLNGTERPVSFDVFSGKNFEIVHSLAKWKRFALKMYGFEKGEGLYTDMNAIRRDEDTDNIHSIFVDQWDWEKIISKEERTLDYLKKTVKLIYAALRHTEFYITKEYNFIGNLLPEKDQGSEGTLNVEEYKSSLTQEVTALCERVAGAGRVSLVIHFTGTEEYVYATDKSGSGGKEYVYTSGSGLLLRVDYPAVDGVSVLCEGGDDAAVRREMTDLLSSLLGIGANRIHIGKGNFNGAS